MKRLSADVAAVFLDVGGVFHLPSHPLVLAALRRAGVDAAPDRLDRAHYAGVAALEVWPSGDGNIWRAYEEAYAREVGVPPAQLEEVVAEIDAAFAGPEIWSRQVPGSVEALRRLHDTGIALAIVSNSDGTLERRLATEGICQMGPGAGVPMSIVIDSAVVGVAKPDPAIFTFALEATGVTPDRAVHVGDTVGADVEGARAAGVHPLHLDPFGFCDDRSHDHIADLDELVAALNQP